MKYSIIFRTKKKPEKRFTSPRKTPKEVEIMHKNMYAIIGLFKGFFSVNEISFIIAIRQSQPNVIKRRIKSSALRVTSRDEVLPKAISGDSNIEKMRSVREIFILNRQMIMTNTSSIPWNKIFISLAIIK
jgi:hypothetical protein